MWVSAQINKINLLCAPYQIVIADEGSAEEPSQSWHFPLRKGEAYVLSGYARNKCLHGVLANGW